MGVHDPDRTEPSVPASSPPTNRTQTPPTAGVLKPRWFVAGFLLLLGVVLIVTGVLTFDLPEPSPPLGAPPGELPAPENPHALDPSVLIREWLVVIAGLVSALAGLITAIANLVTARIQHERGAASAPPPRRTRPRQRRLR